MSLEIDHLDALNSDELKTRMIKAFEGSEKVILYLETVDFIDSSGLGVVLTLIRHVNETKGSMVIASMKDTVKVLFKLVRLSHMKQIFDSEKEALAHL